MALSVGSVSVNSETGEHTGSGCVYEMLDAWWTAKGGEYSAQTTAVVVAVKEAMAELFGAVATGIISEFTSNAEVEVTISTSTGGLQQVDSADTDPPATQKTLPGTVS